jgi:transposase
MAQRVEVVLRGEQREVLERWARRPTSAQALALRCRIVLAAAEGRPSKEIAAELGCDADTVGRWRGRFARRGLDGLHDEPRPGKPRSISDEDVERVIVKTLEEQPANATHWSTRSMAAATGMSQSAISRIWRAFGLKPHQTEAFKLSPDPQFIDKVRDIVGLYLNPPEAAVVLCVDEKAQIQALDRSAPVLPLLPGVAERRSHDYVRNGTTNLYAALDLASGKVIAEMTPRHRAEEFRRFLNLIDKSVPAHLDLHLVLDNSSTHKTPSIQRWLVRHPRFTLHFTPTYSSWLNLVERWFAELTTKWIKRGTHRSVRDLVASIRTWIANWNDNPKPYVWHKTADQILDSLAAYCQRINASRHWAGAGSRAEAGPRSRRSATRHPPCRAKKEGGSWGNPGFPHAPRNTKGAAAWPLPGLR